MSKGDDITVEHRRVSTKPSIVDSREGLPGALQRKIWLDGSWLTQPPPSLLPHPTVPFRYAKGLTHSCS